MGKGDQQKGESTAEGSGGEESGNHGYKVMERKAERVCAAGEWL